ncbi:hypothetical protein MWH25_08575 [Natroniella acetigena]|uniref:hypothetical protein n=1 Tax=Natroniella acetigena TaxID=52004 RepID=UPI00200AEA03|nr:hypothetical protein [Natroniella acetigena]MCK8827794.1 hypothetical protein [Natroniella acetigena]
MEFLDQIFKISLFRKVLNKEKLTAKEFSTLILILYEKDIAFELTFTPKTTTDFPTFELNLIFSPNLELTFKVIICE